MEQQTTIVATNFIQTPSCVCAACGEARRSTLLRASSHGGDVLAGSSSAPQATARCKGKAASSEAYGRYFGANSAPRLQRMTHLDVIRLTIECPQRRKRLKEWTPITRGHGVRTDFMMGVQWVRSIRPMTAATMHQNFTLAPKL
jgi:hypothetical protein